MIRKAKPKDLSRIAEILVFTKRIKYRSIFRNDEYSFNELQVVKVADEFKDPELLGKVWIYDDGIVKLLIDTIIGEARTSDFKTIVLDSMKQYKEARKLYEKCGFTDCSRYNDNTYADVFMKLELKKEY